MGKLTTEFPHPIRDPALRGCYGGGSSGGGGGTQTTVQQADPWSGAQPTIKAGLQALGGTDPMATARQAFPQALAGTPRTFFPGQTVAPFAPETEQALGYQAELARSMPGAWQAGANQQLGTIGGEYLPGMPQSNPYAQAVSDAVASEVLPAVQSRFVAGNRSGSPGMAEAMARGMTRGLAPYQFGQYQQERQMQEAATRGLPQYLQAGFIPSQALAEVGGARENLAQSLINEEVQRHQFAQTEPWERAMALINAGYGAPGGMSTGTTTSNMRRQGLGIGGILGGAASLAGLGGLLGVF